MDKKRTSYSSQVIRRRKRTFLLSAFALAVFLGLCYLFVWQRVYTIRLAEENDRARQHVRDLKERCATLQFEINQLSSLKRIEDLARNDLDLLPPRDLQLATFMATKAGAAPAKAESTKTTIQKPEPPKKKKTNLKQPIASRKEAQPAKGKPAKSKSKATSTVAKVTK